MSVTPAMNVFPDVHLEDLRAELEPKALGRRLGERDLPLRDALEDQQGQSKIGQSLAEMQDEAVKLRDERLAEIDKGLAELDQPVLRGAMDGVAQQALAEFGDVEQRYAEDLKSGLQEWRKRREDYHDFKEANGLSREPDYYSVLRRVVGGCVLAFVLLLESFMNATFLAEGSETGLRGGWSLAIAFSAVNILAPLGLFGPVSRYVRHVKPVLKLAGWACLLAWVMLALVLNLGLAHYREVSEHWEENLVATGLGSEADDQQTADLGGEVVRHFREQPFGLTTAESWLLFVVGLGFSVLAFYEGWKFWGDSYPGYGAVHLRMIKKKEELDALREEASEELKDVRVNGLGRAKELLDRARLQPAETRRLLKSEEDLLAAFEDHVQHLRSLGAVLVEDYRAANHAVRSDGAAPASHAEPWQLQPPSPHRVRTWEPRAVEDQVLAGLQDEHVETVRALKTDWQETQQRLGMAAGNSGAEHVA